MTTLIEYVQDAGGWFAHVFTKDKNARVFLKLVDDKFLSNIIAFISLMENGRRAAFAEWIVRKRLQELYQAFIEPLQPYLPPAGREQRLVLAPSGVLHQLPLNAAQNPCNKRYLTQEYTLIFTPSLAVLRDSFREASRAKWRPTPLKRALHIAYSGQRDMGEEECLEKVAQSAAEMAEMFCDVKLLTETEATIQATVNNVRNRELVHFFCHGVFEPHNPDQSGLLLYDGFLTYARIVSEMDLSQAHITVLAACQSGRMGRTRDNKPVGLIQALLSVKSKAVVATLWKVNENSTHAFFQHFYHAIKEGLLPAYALSDAAEKIRQTQGWEHPYYWAAFQVSGLAYGMPPQKDHT